MAESVRPDAKADPRDAARAPPLDFFDDILREEAVRRAVRAFAGSRKRAAAGLAATAAAEATRDARLFYSLADQFAEDAMLDDEPATDTPRESVDAWRKQGCHSICERWFWLRCSGGRMKYI